jgi:hypothetical protein
MIVHTRSLRFGSGGAVKSSLQIKEELCKSKTKKAVMRKDVKQYTKDKRFTR